MNGQIKEKKRWWRITLKSQSMSHDYWQLNNRQLTLAVLAVLAIFSAFLFAVVTRLLCTVGTLTAALTGTLCSCTSTFGVILLTGATVACSSTLAFLWTNTSVSSFLGTMLAITFSLTCALGSWTGTFGLILCTSAAFAVAWTLALFRTCTRVFLSGSFGFSSSISSRAARHFLVVWW